MSSAGSRWALSCVMCTLAASISDTGCVRLFYDEVDRSPPLRDAGMDASTPSKPTDAGSASTMAMDAQPRAADGGAAPATDSSTAGMVDAAPPETEGLDAALPEAGTRQRDASVFDAATLAADSGNTVPTDRFADCMQAPGVLFCNGFEEPLPWVPTPWSDHTLTNGTEERDGVLKHGGTAAAHLRTTSNASGTAARIAYQKLGELKSGDLWLRYYYYLPSTVMVDSYFTAAVMSELSAPNAGLSLLIRPGQIQIKSTLIGNKSTGFSFPRDRWVCVEHHVFVSSTAGYFQIYVDGTKMLESNTGNSVPGTGWSSVDVGIHDVATNQSPVEVYVDDVVVSTARYGCD